MKRKNGSFIILTYDSTTFFRITQSSGPVRRRGRRLRVGRTGNKMGRRRKGRKRVKRKRTHKP